MSLLCLVDLFEQQKDVTIHGKLPASTAWSMAPLIGVSGTIVRIHPLDSIVILNACPIQIL
jgi:hypothetical protein